MAGEGGDGRGRTARWQGREGMGSKQQSQIIVTGSAGAGGGYWGQEGQRVGVGGGWQAARWGRGSGGKEGQITGEEGHGRGQEGQIAVSGGSGSRRRLAGCRNSKWAGS